MKDKKFVEIWLPMFKQGDDLAHHLEHSSSPAEAFEGHAAQMVVVSNQLRAIAAAIRETETNSTGLVDVEAGTHFIGLTGPNHLISRLLKEELAHESEWEDDEEDEYLEDETWDDEEDLDE